MIEIVFRFSHLEATQQKLIEKLIVDENLNYLHMMFMQDQSLPEHLANSNVYMTVMQGTLSIALDTQAVSRYTAGNVLKIPKGTKMNVGNKDREVLELLVVKVPPPN